MTNTYVSLYQNVKTTDKIDISLQKYVSDIRDGKYQDLVLKARSLKQSGNIDEYKSVKSTSSGVTGSAQMKQGSRSDKNIQKHNGLLVIDIDDDVNEELFVQLKNDRYSFITHRSFGGDGLCIFVKIDERKHKDSFDFMAQYYYENYDVVIDRACSNPSRFRFNSYDPFICVNESSQKVIPKDLKRFVTPDKKKTEFIFTGSDFDYIIDQISAKGIDLCAEEYSRYTRIGLAIASEMGESGRQYFHKICSYGSKYNERRADRDYSGFVKGGQGECGIGTLYFYCKEAGLDVYSKKTIATIKAVSIQKSQGEVTQSSVLRYLKEVVGEDGDKALIDKLIESKNDFSAGINTGDTKVEIFTNFIKEVYFPSINIVSKEIYISGRKAEQDWRANIHWEMMRKFEDIYSERMINIILESGRVWDKIDPITDFINKHAHNETGFIDTYAKSLRPFKDEHTWMLKNFLVGMIHNFFRSDSDTDPSNYNFVLSGGQNTGKSMYCRGVMPVSLRDYFIDEEVDPTNKDHVRLLSKALVLYDDELTGFGRKEVDRFKKLTSKNKITMRVPYGKSDESFKRISSFMASTNKKEILKDSSGNRRWLIINLQSIDWELSNSVDKNKMFVEAYNLYKSGYEWRLTPEQISALALFSAENNEIDPIEEWFLDNYSLEYEPGMIKVALNKSQILHYMGQKYGHSVNRYSLNTVFEKLKLDFIMKKVNNRNQRAEYLYIKTELYNQLRTGDEDDTPF